MSRKFWVLTSAMVCSLVLMACDGDSDGGKNNPVLPVIPPMTDPGNSGTPGNTVNPVNPGNPINPVNPNPPEPNPAPTPVQTLYGACSLSNSLGGAEMCVPNAGGKTTCTFANVADCSSSFLCGIFEDSSPFCTYRCVPEADKCASGNCACPAGINCVAQCPNGAACSEWISGSGAYYCLPAEMGSVVTPTPTPTPDPTPTPTPDPTPTPTPTVGVQVGDSCNPDKTGDVCSGANVLACDEDTGKYVLKGICETGHVCVATTDVVDCFKPCTAADVNKKTPVCYDIMSMTGVCQAFAKGYYYIPDEFGDMMLCNSGCENGECVKAVADEGSPCSESTFKQRCEGSKRVFCEDALSHRVSSYECNDGDSHYCMIDGSNEADCVYKCTTPGPMYDCLDYDGQTDIYDMRVSECEMGPDGNLYKVWKETKESCGKSCNAMTGECK